MLSEVNIHRILQVLTVHYLILTKQEVEAWQEDPLKFYMDAKNESNECKGNYLRSKAMTLIANFRINHDTAFSSFVNYIVNTELPKIGTGQLELPKQLEKDAMLQVVLIKAHDRVEDDPSEPPCLGKTEDFVKFIETELQSVGNLMVKRRAM
jgi:hypothetical protein